MVSELEQTPDRSDAVGFTAGKCCVPGTRTLGNVFGGEEETTQGHIGKKASHSSASPSHENPFGGTLLLERTQDSQNSLGGEQDPNDRRDEIDAAREEALDPSHGVDLIGQDSDDLIPQI